jgi:hypothetical protein
LTQAFSSRRSVARHLASGFVLSCALTARAPSALAQTPDEKAAAEVLFNDARHLMDGGSYAAACSKLEDSQRIDPAIGTLGWLARCYEQLGRTASAWATYKQVASMAKQQNEADRSRIATERAAALEPALSRLTIDASAIEAAAGVEVVRNGNTVDRALWGQAMPVDPGDQRVEVRGAGYKSAVLVVTVLANGDQKSVRLPSLEKSNQPVPAAASTPAPQVATPMVTQAASPEADTRAPSHGQAIAGYVVGGVGVVGLVVGAVFLADTRSKLSARDAACPSEVCRSDQAANTYAQKQSDARTSQTISDVSLIAGGAALATGLVLIFTAPKSASGNVAFAPYATRDGAGASLGGTW